MSNPQYITLKWDIINFLVGSKETIEVVDKSSKVDLFVYTSENGVHVCSQTSDHKSKIQALTKEQAKRRQLRLVKKDSPYAKKYEGKCLLGWQYAEKIEQMLDILDPHKERDRRPKGAKVKAQIGVPVLWSGFNVPTMVLVHGFYDEAYFLRNKVKILKELKRIGIPAQIVQ